MVKCVWYPFLQEKVLDLNVSNGKYVQWEDAANENQRWYIEKVGDSYYIRNHVNHSAMGIRDNAMADGDYVISMDFNANAENQNGSLSETEAHEEINLLEEGKYTIGNGSQVVDIYDTGYGDGVQAITYKANQPKQSAVFFLKNRKTATIK